MPVKKTTAKTASTRKKTTPRSTTTPKVAPKDHIRNLRGAEVRLRFPSQKIKEGDHGIHLQPRGYRGDIEKIPTKEDLNSKYYFDNLDLLYEALTADEARDVVSKQSVNEQTRVHPAQAMLRNELDQPYADGAVQLEVPYEQQGKVVGTVDLDGRKNVQINRTTGPPERANVPGSQDELSALEYRDQVARQKGAEGPSAGLAGIRKVTVEDVERS